MPVFIRDGGMMVERTNYVDYARQRPLDQLTVDLGTGRDGDFTLYEDAGEGNGYRAGQSATTRLSWRDAARSFTIGAAAGSYPGQVTSRSYTLRVYNASAASTVSVDGTRLPASALRYDPSIGVLTVTTPSLSTGAGHAVTFAGNGSQITGPGGRCVDVANANPADGTPIQLYDCNRTNTQQRLPPGDGTLRALDKCMDVAGGGTASGVPTKFPGVTPQLTVPNTDAAVRFYREAFGADELLRNHGPDGRVMHCELLINGGRLLLHDEFPDNGHELPVTAISKYCSMSSLVCSSTPGFPAPQSSPNRRKRRPAR